MRGEGTLVIAELIARVTWWIAAQVLRKLCVSVRAGWVQRLGLVLPLSACLLLGGTGVLGRLDVSGQMCYGEASSGRLPGIQHGFPPLRLVTESPGDSADSSLSLNLDLPRFVRLGDSFYPRLTLYNHLAVDLKITSTLKADGLSLAEPGDRVIQVPARAEALLTWTARAQDSSLAHLVASVEGPSGTITTEASLPILPTGEEETVEQRGRLWKREWLSTYLAPQAPEAESLLRVSPSMIAILLKDYAIWQGLPY